ncbi:heme-binding protein [Luteimonas sp. SJ-92]|uniref:Heme-binding protein n=1 Tax=Luteimonas salinisoli TaxID=2752307 RepID=A0A853JBG0_9GAMM|nr:heme-binding protein [Luteimonas salinisoli]NZA26551.1 heme-binding protein [Luteimonas salinisoli]
MKGIVSASLVATAALLASMGSQAQTPRPVLDFETADAIRDHCLARAAEAGHAVAVAVFDDGGDLVSFSNHGASPAAAAVAQWKGRSAAMYRRSTRETAAWNVPTAPMIAVMEGGVPLFARDGTAIGGVGVSGAPSEFDAECGTRAAEAASLTVARPQE